VAKSKMVKKKTYLRILNFPHAGMRSNTRLDICDLTEKELKWEKKELARTGGVTRYFELKEVFKNG